MCIRDRDKTAMISQAYDVFEITNSRELLPEYLMMWFRRPEFDRYARFISHGSVREMFSWEDLCEVKLPIPALEKQKEIVKEYNIITDRIALNNRLIQKLEETAQAIYKQWFVDMEDGAKEKVQIEKYLLINPNLSIKKDALVRYVEMSDLSTDSMCINGFIRRPFTAGSKFQLNDTLLARITPCLENGKTGFVNFLDENEIAYGSTEFIVMRAKNNISPYWVYCLAKDENFRSYAISSMVGSSGRERVHEDYLKHYLIGKLDYKLIADFHNLVKPIFELVANKNIQRQKLEITKNLLLSKLATIEI